MNHTPLGEICVSLGLMRAEDVDAVRARLREGRRARFGEIAIEMGLLDDEGLARALAHQFRLNMVPADRLARLSVAPEVVELLPTGLIRERLLVPTFLDEEKRVLSLLTPDPTDIPSLRAAQTAARAARLRLFVAARGAMRELVERLLPAEDPLARPDRATVAVDEHSARGITVVFEPDSDRAALLRRMEAIEGGTTEVVGDPEQVSAFIEANKADRVFLRRDVLPDVEPYLAAWKRLRPLVYVCAVDGYAPGRRVAIPYDRTREFFFGVLGQLLEDAQGAAGAVRTVELARAMAEQAEQSAEHRDTITLAALFWGLAAMSLDGDDDAAALDGAVALARRTAPPYDVLGLYEALAPRVRGESGPGVHPGAEILYTARSVARAAAAAPEHDAISAMGGGVARHDGGALTALDGVLRRDELRERILGRSLADDPGDDEGLALRLARPGRTAAAIEPEAGIGAGEEEATEDGPSLMSTLRRVLWRRPSARPAVAGRLADLSLPEVLQTLTLGGRTARVQVLGGAERGVVQVRDGRLAAAIHGARVGEPALHSLVAAREGRFEVHFEDDGVANLTGASEFLLLEALRRRDEQRGR